MRRRVGGAGIAVLAVGGASVVGGWASRQTSSATVSTALWDSTSTVSSDTLLLAVLSGSADDEVERYEGSTR
jgi:hypothetical protein